MKTDGRLFIKEALALLYLIYRAFKKLIWNKQDPRLRVLLYHDIPAHKVAIFEKQILHIRRKWKFITPKDFEKYCDGSFLLDTDAVLLTFDDGFKSNRLVAENVLKKYNIKAIFFVVTKFIEIMDVDNSKEFIAKNIIPNHSVDDSSEISNMSTEDLKFLRDEGHEIGSHTVTHAKLTDDQGLNKIEFELSNSKKFLEKKLNKTVRHFAYTFGDINSFGKVALGLAARKYDFIYSGLRGVNCKDENNSKCIKRDSINLNESCRLVDFYLDGGVDALYLRDLKLYRQWIKLIE